jgi:hypothetical protein
VSRANNRTKLVDITTLIFKKGAFTTSRKSAPLPQVIVTPEAFNIKKKINLYFFNLAFM